MITRFRSWRFWCLGALAVAACQPLRAQSSAPSPPSGTRRMAERLQELARSQNPMEDNFLNRQRVEIFRQRLAAASTPGEAASLRPQFATELLNAGDTEEALRELETIRQLHREGRVPLSSRNFSRFQLMLGLAYLRLGEQENCLTNHTTESCLLPIGEAGVHRLPRGSRSAVQVLTELLRQFPTDLKARWLLNIAYMTLGEYPDKVPPAWLIPPQAFASDYDIKRFRDVAGGLGLDDPELAGGSITEDFDNDGYLDVLASVWDLKTQIRFFRNNRDGTFHEATAPAGLEGVTGGLNMIQADYDNDGWVDVFLLRGAWRGPAGRHPNSLLRNLGDGRFEDVTEQAGVLSFHPTQTAVWFDYNNDGWLDLFVGNESLGADVHACELFRNNRNGTFTECAAQAGVANVGFVKGTAAGDYNNDGRLDLYLSRRNEPNLLYRNDGPKPGSSNDWTFTEVGAAAGVTEPLVSFPTWFWDYDNDGWLDIFVSGYNLVSFGDVAAEYLGLPHNSERARLFRNNRDGTFTNITQAARLDKLLHAMGANFGDLDNDGWLDFYLGTGDPELGTLIPNRMFRNAEGKFFQDVTTSGGFGHLQKGHGISFADLDNDGDQDIYHVVGGAYSGDTYRNALFENPGHGNHWLTFKLEGVQSNRSALGARIRVVVKTANGERTIHKTVSTGGSFGASPLRQEIGLGQAAKIERVEVAWPVTGRVQVLTGLEMDRFYKIREGDSSAQAWPLKKFSFVLVPDKRCAPYSPLPR